jgi:hypothetical protein
VGGTYIAAVEPTEVWTNLRFGLKGIYKRRRGREHQIWKAKKRARRLIPTLSLGQSLVQVHPTELSQPLRRRLVSSNHTPISNCPISSPARKQGKETNSSDDEPFRARSAPPLERYRSGPNTLSSARPCLGEAWSHRHGCRRRA